MLSNVNRLKSQPISSESMVKELSAPNNTKTENGQNIGEFLNKLTGNSADGAPNKTKTKNKDEMSKEDFMTLLVAELKNQNPLEPMKNQEFGAQLAQFSQLEQLEGVNKNIAKLALAQEPVAKLYSASLIGRSVITESIDFNHEKGKDEELSFNLPSKAQSLEVKIKDSTDRVIRKIKMEKSESGLNYVKWDGRGDDGILAIDGRYKFEVEATDERGTNIAVQRGISGKVVSVDYKDNDVSLMLEGGSRVKIKDVKTIGDGDLNIKKAVDAATKEAQEAVKMLQPEEAIQPANMGIAIPNKNAIQNYKKNEQPAENTQANKTKEMRV